MTRLDARPDSLDVSFRPGSTVTLNLNGPAGWLTSRSFTATLNGTSLSVSEDGDTLVVVASSGVTTALGSLGAKYPLVIHQSGGNDQIIGTWTASDGPALSRTVDATVLVDTIEVGVTILGSGTGGGGGGGAVDSVVAGTNVTVDSSDPANPIVSATGGGGGAPSGPAGGVLGGTYPNPSFAADMATQGELDAVAAAKENVGVAAALVDDLSGVTNQSQARTNLGLGTAATTAATAYATAAQGTKADTAVQPGSLASVAASGAYADLSGKPTLGSAAAASTSDFDAAGAAAAAQAAAIAASQPVDSDLSAIAALTTTTFGRALLTQADAAATRTTLGLGTAATTASTAYDAAGAAAGAQAASQPLDSDLTAIAALTTTSYGRAFLALADAAAARTALGLGTAATTAATAYATAAQGAKADTAVQPADLVPKMTTIGTQAVPITDENTTRPSVTGPVYWLMATGVTPNHAIDGDLIWTDGALSAVVETVTATNGSILVDNTDPENPTIGAGVYVWNGSAYMLQTGRKFVGPADPGSNGFTLADGDWWGDTT